jgi:hypothetical protein
MRLRGQLNYANVMSTIAVVVAVAGGSTAVAVTVNASKKSDVNKKGNIRAERVTAKKIANGAVAASELGAIEVVRAESPGDAVAACPPGTRLLSGGAAQTVGGDQLTQSRPEGNGWFGSATGPVAAYALCLR